MAEKKDKQAIEFEAAKSLLPKDRVAGLKVKGAAAPFGGSWSYDKAADELTLVEPPTVLP